MAPKPQALTFDDIVRDPKRFGAPTFDEFKTNPDKYRKRTDRLLSQVSAGSQIFQHLIRKHTYLFLSNKGKIYRSEKLEEIERIALNEGIPLETLEIYPEMIPMVGGGAHLRTLFRQKKAGILK